MGSVWDVAAFRWVTLLIEESLPFRSSARQRIALARIKAGWINPRSLSRHRNVVQSELARRDVG